MTAKKKPEEKVLQIPGVQKKHITITIKGTSPLLTNRFADPEGTLGNPKDGLSPKGKKPPRDPEAEYEAAIYYTDNSKPAFPAGGIKKAVVDACSFVDLTKVQARGAFFILGEYLPIKGDKPQMHTSTVRIQGRSAALRYRAVYKNWEIDLPIVFNPTVISEDTIANLLENAGFSIGIGDWRPQKNGNFGMFEVKRG